MVVPEGYKQTEVGIIPKEWNVYLLSEVVNFFNGKAHEKNIDESGFFIVVNSKFISTNGSIIKYSNINHCPINMNDITIVMSDIPNGKALAKCYIIEKSNTYALNQRIGGLRSLGSNPKFLYYQLNRNKYYLSFDSGSGQTNLRKQDVLGCPVVLPPLPEQAAIAEALSDMDALIDQTEKLIEKKKAIKQGVMQELLKPKEGWKTRKLGELIKFQTGFPFSSDYFTTNPSEIRLIKNRDLRSDDSIVYYCGNFHQEFIVNDGDLLIGMDGDFEPVLWRKGKALLNQRVGRILKKKEISLEFLSYTLTYELKEIEERTGSTTVKHLSHSDIEKIELILPNEREQKEIALVLTELDVEISLIILKLQKLKLQKQGMMQALLTGKIRLLP